MTSAIKKYVFAMIATGICIGTPAFAETPELCMSTAIYHEARGSTRADRIGVGHVILNRVSDRRFPNDVCSVVYQRGQFSWSRNGRQYRDQYLSLARQIISGEIPDNTNNSLYFWSHRIGIPSWARNKQRIRIGGHYYAR